MPSRYRASILRKNTNVFHFDTEIIIQLLEAGYRITEVPIPTYYGDEICHVNGLHYAWNVVTTTLEYKLHKAGFRYDARFDVQGGRRYLYVSDHGVNSLKINRLIS